MADIEPPIFSKKEIKNNTKDYTPRQKYLFFQRNRTTVKIYLTILSAGATAESRYTEKPFESCLGTGGALDCEYMRKYSNDAFRSGETRAQALRQAIERSAALIQSPLCWRAISDISNAVSDGGKLSFDEADALCRDIYGRERPTIELVRRDWKSSVELINSGNWPP